MGANVLIITRHLKHKGIVKDFHKTTGDLSNFFRQRRGDAEGGNSQPCGDIYYTIKAF